jgi:hypothetical protein
MCTLGFELLDHSDEMADRAREPIEPDNHLGLAGLDLVQLARALLAHRVAASST